MATVVRLNDVLDGQVALDIECLDRIYRNAYVPNLQVGGQVVTFLTQHLGNPIPSPAIFEKIGTAFRNAVSRFAEDDHIPVVRFAKTDRKIERMRPYLAAQAATGRSGVAAIGVAQEFAPVFTGTERPGSNGLPWFSFTKANRRVNCYYFYLWDVDFGPAFIKICSYFPYPAKIWINGHEWAKRQALRAGIPFSELSNGFAATDDPTGLQTICDRLGPGAINVFAQRWLAILPRPLTDADRAAGYWWELSMRQIEVSRTIVFTAPRHARSFFEALVADNLDIGRPEQVELIFSRHHVRRGRPPSAQKVFKTKLVTRGTDVTINAFYKHSRIKQYLKDSRALRIETVLNDPHDLGCQRRLHHLDELQAKARAANTRLLDTERVGQGCVLASPAFERIAHPTTSVDGRRAPALRFGDPRVQALAGALCHTLLAVTGITNKILMSLARRSRVVETGEASPADVVQAWCGLSPLTRLTLEPAPVGYSGLPPFERESQTLDVHAGSAGAAPGGVSGRSPRWRLCMSGSPRSTSARRSSRWRYVPQVSGLGSVASRCASSTPTTGR